MEKKGELLNQLAIISDLLEKINTETISRTVVLELNKEEFESLICQIGISKNDAQAVSSLPSEFGSVRYCWHDE